MMANSTGLNLDRFGKRRGLANRSLTRTLNILMRTAQVTHLRQSTPKQALLCRGRVSLAALLRPLQLLFPHRT